VRTCEYCEEREAQHDVTVVVEPGHTVRHDSVCAVCLEALYVAARALRVAVRLDATSPPPQAELPGAAV
jgi:hypothetical protein